MPGLRVIEDLMEFENLKNVWNEVLQRSLDNDIFSTWEWVWYWWKHFGKNRKLRMLIAEEKGEIAGIAPFMLSKYGFPGFGKFSRIEFIGFPHADYNNFILPKRDLNCLKFFLKSLVDFSDWDLLDLRDIRYDSFSGQALEVLAHSRAKDPKLRVMDGTLCPHIVLPNSVEGFVRSLSQNMREQLKKKFRRLCRNFNKVEFKTHRDFGFVDEAMDAFFKLHQKRWKAKCERGAFADEDFRNFHLNVARIFSEKGWLNLHFLVVNDVPVAADYSFNYNGKTYSYLTGFDPEFSEYSVMNLLRLHMVEESIKKGLKEFDLTRDFEPYKADWANGVRKNIVVRHVRKGLSARMYCWALENSVSLWLSKKLGVRLTRRGE